MTACIANNTTLYHRSYAAIVTMVKVKTISTQHKFGSSVTSAVFAGSYISYLYILNGLRHRSTNKNMRSSLIRSFNTYISCKVNYFGSPQVIDLRMHAYCACVQGNG